MVGIGLGFVKGGGAAAAEPWWKQYKQNLVDFSSVTVTCDTAAHTYGAWSEMVASTSADSDFLVLGADVAQASTNTSTLIDVGIGAAGAESVVVAGLAVGGWAASSVAIPLKVPAGSRVAYRAQSIVTGGKTLGGRCALFDTGTYASAPTSVDVLGTSTATSTGTFFSSTSTYIEIVASSAAAYSAIIAVPSLSTAGASNGNYTITVGTGASGSETNIGDLRGLTDSGESFRDWYYKTYGLFSGSYASSTRFAAKSSVGGNGLHICLIGVPA